MSPSQVDRLANYECFSPWLAQDHSGLEDIDQGLEWWQKAIEEKNRGAAIAAQLSLRPLVAEPRDRALVGRLGIPQTETLPIQARIQGP